MSIVTIFSASYCHGQEISEKVAKELNLNLLDRELFELVSRIYHLSEDKFKAALTGSSSLFGKILEDRDKNVAYIRAALAELVERDGLLYHGFAGLLLPREITHILRVCLVAENDYRIKQAVEQEGLSEGKAESAIKKDDSQRLNWTNYLFNVVPWDDELHDIVLPMHTHTVKQAVDMIVENARKEVVQTTLKSQQAIQDFLLASQVKVVMTEKKHNVDVRAEEGKVIVILKKYVMRLEHYKHELQELAEKVPGVNSVEFEIGSSFRMPSTYPPVELDVPKKVLLVDDEVEFVETLSERLQSRQMKSSVVYNGEEALSFVESDQPEVMVLDLKMPGIDGLEVLRRTKQDHPETEVIILTGHGSEREKQKAYELGAFAYLEKPVDIDVLTETMKKAYAKVNQSKKDEQ